MYAMDSPKRRASAMNTGVRSPACFRELSWFILQADRDIGQTAYRPLRRTTGGSLVLSQAL